MFTRMYEAIIGTRKRSWATIAVWVLAVAVLSLLSPAIGDVQSPGDGGPPDDAPSIQAQQRLDEAFPEESDALPGIIAVKGDTEEQARDGAVAVVKLLAETAGERTMPPISPLCADPASGLRPGEDCIPGRPDGTVSEDGLTHVVIVPVTGDPTADEFREEVDELRERIQAAAKDAGANEAPMTGPAGIITDTVNVFASSDVILFIATGIIVLVILLLVYRSPVLAVLPLIAVGVALGLAQSIGALLADAGAISVDAQTAAIMTVLLFGVGTDYALVINARYRERMADQRNGGGEKDIDPHAAMVSAMRESGEVLASSAGTIILAMLALLFTTSPTLQGFGPYLAIGVLSMALVAATFLPALLLVAGKSIFWPGGRDKALTRVDSKIWTKVADIIDEHPAKVLAGTLALLLALSAGLLGYKETSELGFRVDTDSERGRDIIAAELGAGEIAPTTMLLEGEGLTPEMVAETGDRLAERPDVSRVAVLPDAVNDEGTAATMTVILAADPYSAEALDAVPAIEDAAAELLADAGARGDVNASATGETAETTDTRETFRSDLLLLMPLVFGVIGVVLGMLLRSVLAPIYLVGTLILSFTATLGVTVLVAVTIMGDSGIADAVPAYILVFATALGVDYTIFMMARLRQEMRDSGMRQSMRLALIRTGGVVSSAGLILAATFAVLTAMPIRELFQFGLALAMGILLDTFIIRPLLVPALVRLVGDKALWPSKPAMSADEAEAAKRADADTDAHAGEPAGAADRA